MIFNAAELAALESGTQRIGVFFRLETDPVVRLWLGAGNIKPGINTLDAAGAEYKGFGALPSVPAFKQLINGAAVRVDFTLSGVSGDLLQIASGNDAEQVKGKPVAVGFALMDSSWALLGAVKWCAIYTADFLSVEQRPADAFSPIVRSIGLSCGSRFTARRRPAFSYFTDQDQQARYPGDLFCSLTGRYALAFNVPWPVYA
jgi:hypothetical protein